MYILNQVGEVYGSCNCVRRYARAMIVMNVRVTNVEGEIDNCVTRVV